MGSLDKCHTSVFSVLINSLLSFFLTFSQRQILHSSKLKGFRECNFKSDENDRKFSKRVENSVGKGEIARHEQFLLFRQCFQKTCTADTKKTELVQEMGNLKCLQGQ